MCKTAAIGVFGYKQGYKERAKAKQGWKRKGDPSPHLATNIEQNELPSIKQKSFESTPLNVFSVPVFLF